MITLQEIKQNESIKALVRAGNRYLETLGYTDHGPRHLGYVSRTASGILKSLGYSEREVELAAIAGQQPLVTKARKSIANFKLREGMNVGAKVTLRGSRMEEFMDKLVNIALPRVRDFRGVSDKAFDGRGNYALGIREQLLFPEIEYDKVEKIRGMEMIFVTTAKTDEECKELLRLLGMPFAQ